MQFDVEANSWKQMLRILHYTARSKERESRYVFLSSHYLWRSDGMHLIAYDLQQSVPYACMYELKELIEMHAFDGDDGDDAYDGHDGLGDVSKSALHHATVQVSWDELLGSLTVGIRLWKPVIDAPVPDAQTIERWVNEGEAFAVAHHVTTWQSAVLSKFMIHCQKKASVLGYRADQLEMAIVQKNDLYTAVCRTKNVYPTEVDRVSACVSLVHHAKQEEKQEERQEERQEEEREVGVFSFLAFKDVVANANKFSDKVIMRHYTPFMTKIHLHERVIACLMHTVHTPIEQASTR